MRKAGFTLIELVVALALLGILSVLLLNGLRLAARTWDAMEARTRTVLDLHLAAAFVRRQMEQAQPLDFSGEPDSVRFVSPLPAHLGSGGMHAFTLAVAERRDGKALLLTYRLYQGERWERLAQAKPEVTVLASGLREVRFEYLGHGGGAASPWSARWTEKERLPRLVRLSLRYGGEADWREIVLAPKLTTAPPEA